MFFYKKENQLITSALPIEGLTSVNLSSDDVLYFTGFDNKGKPIIDYSLKQNAEKENSNLEIKKKLAEIDLKSIRALRDNDTEWIKKYSDQAKELRAQLK